MGEQETQSQDFSLEVGTWRVEPSLLRIQRRDEERRLEPKAMELLLFLADRAPRVVTRAEIFDHVWQGRAVVDGALSRCVSLLRQALGDDPQVPSYIETIPRKGYRLVAPVARQPADGAAGPGAVHEPASKAVPPDVATSNPAAPNPAVPGISPAEIVAPGKAVGPPLVPAMGASDTRSSDDTAAGATAPESPRSESASSRAATDGTRTRTRPVVGVAAVTAILVMALGLWLGSAFRDSQTSPSTPTAVSGLTETRTGPPRLAVLPFDNLSGDTGDSYLADGLTEELIHQLSTLSALRVVSRTSVLAVQRHGAEAPEVAERLRADYLLEGSVLSAGEGLRITVQLILPRSDEHVWSRTYDKSMADVLTLQRQVAKDVAAQVAAAVTPREQERLDRPRAVDSEAYRHYLQGRRHLNQRTRADVRKALEHFQTAIDRSPDLADAWAALAEAHLISEPYLRINQASAYARAQAAIDQALKLDPDLAKAQVCLGLLLLFRDWDWSGSEAAYRRAVTLEPSSALAHQWLSEMLSLAGRHEEALEAVRRAVDLDPLSPLVHAAWGQRLNAAGRHRQALDRFDEADLLGATFTWHWRERAYAHVRLGNQDQAVAAQLRRVRRRVKAPEEWALVQEAVEKEGMDGFWRWHLPWLLRPPIDEPMLIAEAYAQLGQTEEALPWLRTAVAKRGGWFLHLSKSPAFDDLRQDPRFQDLLRQAGQGP